jgi:hypothetical protein
MQHTWVGQLPLYPYWLEDESPATADVPGLGPWLFQLPVRMIYDVFLLRAITMQTYFVNLVQAANLQNYLVDLFMVAN